MGAAVSSSQIFSAAPLSSGRGLFTLFPCSSVGRFPWKIILHKLFQCIPFPQAAVLHKLLKHESLPWGSVLQNTPLWGHKSCQKTCSSLDSSLHTFTGPSRSLLQHRFLTGPQLLLGSHLLWLQGNLCSTACSTCSPPSSLTWVSAGLFHIFPLFSSLPAIYLCAVILFPP